MRRHATRSLLPTLALALLAAAGCHEITSVTPDPTVPGGPVRIEGRGFGDVQGESRVLHAGEEIPIDSWSDRLIEARLSQRPLPGVHEIEVIVDGRGASYLHTIPDADTQCDIFYTLLADEVRAELEVVQGGGTTWCGGTGDARDVVNCTLLRHNDEDNPRNRNQTTYTVSEAITSPASSCRVGIGQAGTYSVSFTQYFDFDSTEPRSYTVSPD